MRKELFLIIILGLTLFLSSCNQQQTSQSKTFVGGTQGVVMSFIDGMPPESIISKGLQPFNVMVNLKNVGEYDATGYIELMGLNPADVNLEKNDLRKEFKLVGTHLTGAGAVIPGQSKQVGWSNLKYSPAIISGSVKQTIKVKSCYNYGTIAIVNTCISDDQSDTSGSSSCKVNELKQVSNSGAPVQVVEAQESSGGNDNGIYTYFITLKIKNLGQGQVFDPSVDYCDWSNKGLSDMDKVFVSVKPLSKDVKVECFDNKNEGIVYLAGSGDNAKTGEFMCTMTYNDVVGSFTVPLQINLTYKYSEIISKDIEIKANK